MKPLLLFFLLPSIIAYSQTDSGKVVQAHIDPRTGEPDSATAAWLNAEDKYRGKQDSIKLSEAQKQENMVKRARENPLLQDREGKGNGSFVLSVHTLEMLIKNRTTIKQLEQVLGTWNTGEYLSTISFEWNEKTHEHDIPNYEVGYKTTVRGKVYTVIAETHGKAPNLIRKMEVVTKLNGMGVAEFRKSLQDNGYLINENLTEMFHKQTWESKATHLTIT
jgi:hypothetical protein